MYTVLHVTENMDSDQTSQLNESERQSQEKINQLMSEQADLKQQCKAQSQDNANFSR